jgi:hypothetical protein
MKDKVVSLEGYFDVITDQELVTAIRRKQIRDFAFRVVMS